MRIPEKTDRTRLIQAAMQIIPCDLTVENIQFVNMFTGEIYPASVDVLDGIVVRVREKGEETTLTSKEIYNGMGNYLIPGFIDVHMHVESTMMIPENFGRAVVPWGTTTVCTDPHEIANVMGIDGVKFMLENGRRSALRHFILAPSCVPSSPGFENSGAVFTAKEVGELLDLPDVVGIAEIMDFSGVYQDSKRMHSIIDEGIKRGVYLQGHAPKVTGKELAAYRLGGPIGDHESVDASEVREKLRNGIHINLRATSFADDMENLVKGFDTYKFHDFVSICTDDVHASDLLNTGHVNRVVRRAVELGLDPVDVIRFATLNAAREFGFDDLGAVGPGYQADFQLVGALDGRMPKAVFIKGKLVAKNGVYLMDDDKENLPHFPNTVNIPQIQSPEDFILRAPDGCESVLAAAIVLTKTDDAFSKIEWIELPVKDGCVNIDDHEDLCYVCVANRYGNGGKTIALLKDKRMKNGAYGTTISHDSHNLTILYRNIEDAFSVAMTLAHEGGGICVACDGKIDGILPLPVAGLMSILPVKPLDDAINKMKSAVDNLYGEKTSLLQASVLALPCMPGVVITDVGLVDTIHHCIVSGIRKL